MQLASHTIVVTGGARGLGAVLAHAIAAEGAHVIIADVLEDEGRETSQACKAPRSAPATPAATTPAHGLPVR